ncbi:MAG TPA: sigma-70 family RNA polymerase sigma factor [Povalibacter sp.]|uniref:RNA polymerase sigma factor n=1 Tax=Povalibacter sp. TaxID=1962978 RepID=UPI002C97AD35|nr:sigma-70 family RNA polymerase sigma factor [Povalibacter sp.]HMN46278.1 sigma-70 family RNA polymerase sigma factor [Povalibacter sp.]
MRSFLFAKPAGLDATGTLLEADLPSQDAPPRHERTRGAATSVDRRDIEALIGRDYVGLRALIFRRTGDPQVAADLLNDAICTALEKYRDGQIDRPEEICGYVFQVAMNHLRNHRRSIAERPERRADARVFETLVDEDDDGFDDDSRILDQVIRIIRSLPSERDRRILMRFYLDEEDRDVICRELGLTPAQFASVLHRARQRLKDLLETHGLTRADLFSFIP